MPAFNFQRRFAGLVAAGVKRQTIRAIRKDGRIPKVGDTAYLYTGMRTKKCQRLNEGPILEVNPITIGRQVSIAGVIIDEPEQLRKLATNDGFNSFEEFRTWFEWPYGLPFRGYLTKWDPARTSGICQYCMCTDADCSQCIERLSQPCWWVDDAHTICSACAILGGPQL